LVLKFPGGAVSNDVGTGGVLVVALQILMVLLPKLRSGASPLSGKETFLLRRSG
jgi:hypothetical protein